MTDENNEDSYDENLTRALLISKMFRGLFEPIEQKVEEKADEHVLVNGEKEEEEEEEEHSYTCTMPDECYCCYLEILKHVYIPTHAQYKLCKPIMWCLLCKLNVKSYMYGKLICFNGLTTLEQCQSIYMDNCKKCLDLKQNREGQEVSELPF